MTVKVLYLDIETSPILADTWGLWQQNVGIAQIHKPQRIIGFGYKWRGGGKAKWVGEYNRETGESVSYTHLTLPTKPMMCRSRWSPYH